MSSLLSMVARHGPAAGHWRARQLLKVVVAALVLVALLRGDATGAHEAPARDVSDNTSDALLSADQFVDQTEAPVLLFDGGLRPDAALSPTAAPTTNKPSSTASNSEIGETANSTRATPTPEATTGGEDGDSTGGPEENEPADESAEDETNRDNSNNQSPFKPPQNVSQYMDYIETLFRDLGHQITDLFEPHIPQLIRTSQMVQLTGPCSHDMLRLALALRHFEPWALRIIDSSGKLPEGIFEGSFTALGSYDQCLGTTFKSASSSANVGHSASSGAGPAEDRSASPAATTPPTQGKYCLVNVSPFLPPKPPADKVERMFQEEANRRNYTKDDQFSRLSPMFYYMKFRIGVCIPSTCDQTDMESISQALSSSLRLNITIPDCRIRQAAPLTGHQLAGGLVFASVLALVALATLLDWSRRNWDRLVERELGSFLVAGKLASQATRLATPGVERNPSGASQSRTSLERLDEHWKWMSFSLLANFKLHFKRASPAVGLATSGRHEQRSAQTNARQVTNVKCLDGIRVLSLCWVMIANSYITLDPRATKRLLKTREAPRDFLFQLVVQASLAIETFFFLSGVLMSLSFARHLATTGHLEGGQSGHKSAADVESSGEAAKPTSGRNKLLRWLQFYVHRYVRMTPATMLVIAVSMFAYRYGDGPLWFEATHRSHQNCRENWWRHLLHVANFIDTRQMCFIHYWYIAADMQLFLFAPLVMLLVHRRRRLGLALVALIGVASAGLIFHTTYERNLPPTLLFYNSDPESRREFGNAIMTKPLTHALPYLVGMLVGHWLTSASLVSHAGNQQARHPVMAWCAKVSLTSLLGGAAAVVALIELFLPYKWNNSQLPTRAMASLYAALFRFGWALVLAFVVISCRHTKDKRCLRHEMERRRRQTGCNRGPTAGGGCCCCGAPSLARSTTAAAASSSSSSSAANQYCFCGAGGSPVNRLLSWPVFTHLSKLSFVAYLIHLPLMSVFISQTRGLFAFSHALVIHLALSYLVMTFVLSFALVHVIEFPFITFERYLFSSLLAGRSRRASQTSQAASVAMRFVYENRCVSLDETGASDAGGALKGGCHLHFDSPADDNGGAGNGPGGGPGRPAAGHLVNRGQMMGKRAESSERL